MFGVLLSAGAYADGTAQTKYTPLASPYGSVRYYIIQQSTTTSYECTAARDNSGTDDKPWVNAMCLNSSGEFVDKQKYVCTDDKCTWDSCDDIPVAMCDKPMDLYKPMNYTDATPELSVLGQCMKRGNVCVKNEETTTVKPSSALTSLIMAPLAAIVVALL